VGLDGIKPRDMSAEQHTWFTYTFVNEPVERLISAVTTIASFSGTKNPKAKVQLWPKLPQRLLRVGFKPSVHQMVQALEQLLRDAPAGKGMDVHTIPQVRARPFGA
jgi:hypothetical protein